MGPPRHYTIMRQSKEPTYLRLELVRAARAHGVKPTARAVMTVHGLIEDEFYEVERFSSREEFLAKAATYPLWFTAARTNSYKGHKTPWEIIGNALPPSGPRSRCCPRCSWMRCSSNDRTRRATAGTMLFRIPLAASREVSSPALARHSGTRGCNDSALFTDGAIRNPVFDIHDHMGIGR